MNTSMQEQLRQIRCAVPKHQEQTRPQSLNVHTRRWVVWRKDGMEYKRVCVYDSLEESVWW
jgi:hypothetical protein